MARLHVEILEILLGRIAGGTYAIGSMLPKEETLAAELDVSRGVIRECVRALEERGVVRVTHGRGATVLPARAWDVLDPEVFAAVRSAPGGRRVVAEAVEARAVVLGHAAAVAAERAGPDGLRALTAAVDAIETAPEDGVTAAELEFERALVDAGGNRLIARVAMALAAVAPLRHGRPRGHRRALDAIAAGDAAAAREAIESQVR